MITLMAAAARSLLLFLLLSWFLPLAGQEDRPRTVVTTDGEIDDVDSFLRFLLYSNEMEVVGLVYSSSMWHYRGDGSGTTMVSEMPMTRELYGERSTLRWPGETWIQELLDDYAAVYPTLVTHDDNYPTPEYLRGIVRVGNIDFEGAMDLDTDGSNLIRSILLDDDPRPVYLQAWGGTNTIARALKAIEHTFRGTPAWEEVRKEVSQKAIIYAIAEQDATYRRYIAETWPEVTVLLNGGQFWSLAYGWQTAVPAPLRFWLESAFMGRHVIRGHGPLLANYYSYGDGQRQEGDPEHVHGDPTRLDSAQWGSFQPYDFISEGDTPAFLHLVNVGLDQRKHPEYGGWGGRLVRPDTLRDFYTDSEASKDFNPFSGRRDETYALTRWLPAIQRDFAARADWCVMPFDSANHAPKVTAPDETYMTVATRQRVALRVEASDPDGDDLYYHWFRYGEADSFSGGLLLTQRGPEAWVTIPSTAASGEDIHLIAEVTDGGSPALTRYERFVLTVE